MSASLLDGKYVAGQIRQDIQKTVAARLAEGYHPPGLAVILLGNDPASSIYVNHKRKHCAEVGFNSYAYDLPIDITEKELMKLIDTLNHDSNINGILVQLPLPSHIDTSRIIEKIDPKKDVDGFHPYNFGRLAQGNPLLRPCTPYGVMQLLNHYQLPIASKHAVIVGASNIVGRPMALELLLAKATVTVCHSKTQALEQHVRMADIVVVATGIYQVVKTDWLHEKQVIVDVGMHRNAAGLVHGDIDFEAARKKVDWITPVPGGVGPMTICTLLKNTLMASCIQKN